MKYFIIMLHSVPCYVIPEDTIFPSEFKTIEGAVAEAVKQKQKQVDKEDGVTSKWRRKREVSFIECDGAETTFRPTSNGVKKVTRTLTATDDVEAGDAISIDGGLVKDVKVIKNGN